VKFRIEMCSQEIRFLGARGEVLGNVLLPVDETEVVVRKSAQVQTPDRVMPQVTERVVIVVRDDQRTARHRAQILQSPRPHEDASPNDQEIRLELADPEQEFVIQSAHARPELESVLGATDEVSAE
jgi:hypothetical protein